MSFAPQFEITNSITVELTRIERARGFLDAAKLSEDWIAGKETHCKSCADRERRD